MNFKVTFATKWADFDPNRHMRHTAYNDYAAEVRVRYFRNQKFSIKEFTKYNLGPILFTEETSFRKEGTIPMYSPSSVNASNGSQLGSPVKTIDVLCWAIHCLSPDVNSKA